MDRRLQAQIETDPVLQEATEWLLELRASNVSSQRIIQWQRWFSEAAHRQAFDRVESLWHMAAGVNAQWPSETELAGDEYTGMESTSAWRDRAQSEVSRRGRARWLRYVPRMPGTWSRRRPGFLAFSASAIAVAIVIVLVYWPAIAVFLQGGIRISAHTGFGETRTITLQDGTVLSVGPDTTLTATLRRHSRTIALRSGDAYFRVKKDLARPFTVHAGRSTITDLGTIFDVRHVGSGIVVSVAEGAVRVMTPLPRQEPGAKSQPTAQSKVAMRLKAGQRFALEPFDTAPRISSIDPKWVAGWRRGRLQYLNEPLGSVVADLDRYSNRRIIVTDPDTDIARLRVTASVSVHGIDAWLASLSAAFPVRIVRHADDLIIRPRQAHRLP